MNIPKLPSSVALAMLPMLLRNITAEELAAGVIHAQILNGDVLAMDKHVAAARQLLADAITAIDNLTTTGKFK